MARLAKPKISSISCEDAQLKAAGHEGLNPVNPAHQFITAKDNQGNTLPDPLGLEIQRRRIANAMKYPSKNNNYYILNTAKDMYNNNGTSVWDKNENLVPYLRGSQ